MTDEAKRADEELSRYIEARKDIKHLKEKLEALRSRINAVNRQPRDMDIQHNSDPKAIEELLAALADLSKLYDDQKRDAERLCFVLELSIRDRCHGVSARILSSYYLSRKRLEQIALDEDFCYKQVKRLRHRALHEYGSKMLSQQ